MKNIAVVMAGSGGQIRDLTIKPGTTARDILHEVGMENGILSRGGNSAPFAATDNVYTDVENGTKLYASSEADVGK